MKLINRLFIILISCLLSSVALAKDLTVGLKSEPSSIDPHYHNLGPNNAFATHIYGTLVGSDENQQHYPDLATSWKPINDTTWEFKLRKGVKFHDGSDFTADDVLFTAQRAQNVPKSKPKFNRKKDALRDALGGVLGWSWVVLGSILTSKIIKFRWFL